MEKKHFCGEGNNDQRLQWINLLLGSLPPSIIIF